MGLDVLKKIKKPIFYVTNDPSRGVGLESIVSNYHVVCLDDHPLVELMQKRGVSVFCLEKEMGRKNLMFRSSAEILGHPQVLSFIKEKSKGQIPNIIFFKPQKKLEIIAQKNNFKLIGNSSLLNKVFEDKINFHKIASRENLPILPAEIDFLRNLDFNTCLGKFGLPFVIQFGFGWAGNSTFFISDEKHFSEIQKKFGRIKIKVNRFIKGITVLNNALVLPEEILQSPPAVQIESNPFLTSMPGGTGGRQWPAGLPDDQRYQIKQITEHVGELMRKSGYLGYFGLDFLIDGQSNDVFLSENNARLTASASFYTLLELKNGQIPLLAYHLIVFLDQNLLKNFNPKEKTNKVSGSEIVGRNIFSNPIKIAQSLPAGVYDKDMRYKRESYFLDGVKKGEFWLNAAGEGRIVNPEIEMFKINTLEKVCDSKGELSDCFANTVKKVRSKIKIKNA